MCLSSAVCLLNAYSSMGKNSPLTVAMVFTTKVISLWEEQLDTGLMPPGPKMKEMVSLVLDLFQAPKLLMINSLVDNSMKQVVCDVTIGVTAGAPLVVVTLEGMAVKLQGDSSSVCSRVKSHGNWIRIWLPWGIACCGLNVSLYLVS